MTGAEVRSLEWRRTLLVGGIGKWLEAGSMPTVADLHGTLAMGAADVDDELAALLAEGVVTEGDEGRLTIDGRVPVPPTPAVPEDEVRRRVLEDDLEDPEVPEALRPDEPPAAVAEAHERAAASVQEGGRWRTPEVSGEIGDVRITRGMASSLSDEALGSLVKAGLNESDGEFVLRIG